MRRAAYMPITYYAILAFAANIIALVWQYFFRLAHNQIAGPVILLSNKTHVDNDFSISVDNDLQA